MVSKAMMSIFDNPQTPFIQTKAMDILFNGFKFKCDGDDFSVKIFLEISDTVFNVGAFILSRLKQFVLP